MFPLHIFCYIATRVEFLNALHDVQALLTQAYKSEKKSVILHNGAKGRFKGRFWFRNFYLTFTP